MTPYRMNRMALALVVAAFPLTARAQISQAEYAARRDSLAAHVDSGVIFAAGAREPLDHYPPFKQLAPFRYLTGFIAPDADVVMVKRAGHVTATLYIQSPNARREFYNGARTSPEAITRETGMMAARNESLQTDLDSLAATGLTFWVVSDAESDEFREDDSLSFAHAVVRAAKVSHPSLVIKDLSQVLDQLRARKSPAEIALLEKAAAISDKGHRAVLSEIAPGKNEYEVQALMEYTFRRNGGDLEPAYASIVGSGPNATTLHYDRDSRVMKSGETLVMDCATAFDGYAADITRTVPVNGVFTADERAVYQIVRDAQAAGERQIKPGIAGTVERDSIRAVVAAGLTRLGLIDSAGALIDAPMGFCGAGKEECPEWSLFMPHGPTHGLGLDVHDPAQFYYGPTNAFGVNDVITIEPGVYIRPSVLDILPDTPRNRTFAARVRPLLDRYANIGVRIEDDYVVTKNGVRRITTAPREISEIEAAMRKTVQ